MALPGARHRELSFDANQASEAPDQGTITFSPGT